jgi:hypothetical protein
MLAAWWSKEYAHQEHTLGSVVSSKTIVKINFIVGLPLLDKLELFFRIHSLLHIQPSIHLFWQNNCGGLLQGLSSVTKNQFNFMV